MPNLDQPSVGKISVTHLVFLKPGRRMRGVNRYVAVVVRAVKVIDPGVTGPDGVKWVVRSCRQRGVIGIDRPDLKNSGRRSIIAFDFSRRVPASHEFSTSPGQSMFAKQNGNRRSSRLPSPGGLVEALKLACHTVPVRSDPDNQLGNRRLKTILCSSAVCGG